MTIVGVGARRREQIDLVEDLGLQDELDRQNQHGHRPDERPYDAAELGPAARAVEFRGFIDLASKCSATPTTDRSGLNPKNHQTVMEATTGMNSGTMRNTETRCPSARAQ